MSSADGSGAEEGAEGAEEVDAAGAGVAAGGAAPAPAAPAPILFWVLRKTSKMACKFAPPSFARCSESVVSIWKASAMDCAADPRPAFLEGSVTDAAVAGSRSQDAMAKARWDLSAMLSALSDGKGDASREGGS